MRVRLLTLMAGPGGVWRPGEEVDLPAEQAVELLQRGYAVAVKAGGETTSFTPGEHAVPPRPGTPVLRIKGIGPERAAALRVLGIASVEQLMTADIDALNAALDGTNRPMIAAWVREGRRLLGG